MNRPLKYPEWQTAYLAAVSEVHEANLKQKLAAAEAAIFRRQQALASLDLAEHHQERIALQEAMEGLRILQREKLRFPDWK